MAASSDRSCRVPRCLREACRPRPHRHRRYRRYRLLLRRHHIHRSSHRCCNHHRSWYRCCWSRVRSYRKCRRCRRRSRRRNRFLRNSMICRVPLPPAPRASRTASRPVKISRSNSRKRATLPLLRDISHRPPPSASVPRNLWVVPEKSRILLIPLLVSSRHRGKILSSSRKTVKNDSQPTFFRLTFSLLFVSHVRTLQNHAKCVSVFFPNSHNFQKYAKYER